MLKNDKSRVGSIQDVYRYHYDGDDDSDPKKLADSTFQPKVIGRKSAKIALIFSLS